MIKGIQARHVHKSYNHEGVPHLVLHDISIDICTGQLVSIVGPSGSGKSILLYSLAGMLPVDSGEIVLYGENITGVSPKKVSSIRNKSTAFIFQQYNLLSECTVLENVLLPLKLSRIQVDFDEVNQTLKKFNLWDQRDKYPRSLSGGQAQRVAIARAVLKQSKIVFADEPTGALDSKNSDLVMEELFNISKSPSKLVVMVTHDLDLAAKADSVFILLDGKVYQSASHKSSRELLDEMEALRC